jgi:hypothetical protein
MCVDDFKKYELLAGFYETLFLNFLLIPLFRAPEEATCGHENASRKLPVACKS